MSAQAPPESGRCVGGLSRTTGTSISRANLFTILEQIMDASKIGTPYARRMIQTGWRTRLVIGRAR
jgi:hypothetical protein